ncbi:hypothetical protein EI74_0259 [Mycoplasma testudineum]|uniref:Uncharacterized protein n=1 Tax=Mycoplasma testudineum TaxID=244584 RepID=A0A4R6IDT7_9MOLU|nr:hypothetical protein EI74_0259 [Mycoplasma testudineum]
MSLTNTIKNSNYFGWFKGAVILSIFNFVISALSIYFLSIMIPYFMKIITVPDNTYSFESTALDEEIFLMSSFIALSIWIILFFTNLWMFVRIMVVKTILVSSKWKWLAFTSFFLCGSFIFSITFVFVWKMILEKTKSIELQTVKLLLKIKNFDVCF